jgi:hypothetical protein
MVRRRQDRGLAPLTWDPPPGSCFPGKRVPKREYEPESASKVEVRFVGEGTLTNRVEFEQRHPSRRVLGR